MLKTDLVKMKKRVEQMVQCYMLFKSEILKKENVNNDQEVGLW